MSLFIECLCIVIELEFGVLVWKEKIGEFREEFSGYGREIIANLF